MSKFNTKMLAILLLTATFLIGSVSFADDYSSDQLDSDSEVSADSSADTYGDDSDDSASTYEEDASESN